MPYARPTDADTPPARRATKSVTIGSVAPIAVTGSSSTAPHARNWKKLKAASEPK
jgi:hypothetical protein